LTAQHSPGVAQDAPAEPRAVTRSRHDREQGEDGTGNRRAGLPAPGGSGPALGLFSAPV